MIVVNFFGAPSVGKSTQASGLFTELKRRWVRCEGVYEAAKDKLLSEDAMNDQLRILAEQHHRIFRVRDKVDVVIVDSPLLQSLVYTPADYPPEYISMVKAFWNRYQNVNIYLNRNHPYDPELRVQTEPESIEKDIQLRTLLTELEVPVYQLTTSDNLSKQLANWLITKYDLVSPETEAKRAKLKYDLFDQQMRNSLNSSGGL